MAHTRAVPGAGYGNEFVDALIWGGAAWDPASGPITYYFGEAGEFAAASAIHADDEIGLENALKNTFLNGWSTEEKAAFRYALNLYASVSGLTFQEVGSAAGANIVWWQAPLDDAFGVPGLLGIHETPGDANPQAWGAFNSSTPSCSYLAPGGNGLTTIIHELGHGLGLAHPHDGGGEEDGTTFPGVTFPWDSGDRRLNQGVSTVMSYNDGFDLAARSDAFGTQVGLGAFDIAALQALYGRNMTTRTGNDVYRLPLANEVGTGWSAIWDAGGTDTISGADSTKSVMIDLRAATLKKGAAGVAGFISQAGVIGGGFTIAKGVVIENAVGGSANDRLIGNSADNVLNGGRGADRMAGRGGDDIYVVNNARDTVHDTSGRDTVLTSSSYALAQSARIEFLAAADPNGTKAQRLFGSAFSNTISGNDGANVIAGKGGNDVLFGDRGRDAFLFDTKLSVRTNVDRIIDFSVKDDTIRLDNAVFGALSQTGLLTASAFHVATSSKKLAHDADDRIIYNTSNGSLYYDADGIGGAGAVRFARLDDGLKLKANDFFVV
jgi:serralysin